MPPRWSVEEDRLLRTAYGSGSSLLSIADQVGRSPDAVSERRRTLGIPRRERSRSWTVMEDALVKGSAHAGISSAELATRLQRPPDQVRQRRRELVGAKPAPVTFREADDGAIRVCWASHGDVDALSQELGRSAGSVRLRAEKLGLHHPVARPRWCADEDAVVRDGYECGLTCGQIAAGLLERSPTAVAARAAKLGLATYARVWTAREEQELRRLADRGATLERAATRLSRTPGALRARARKLGITGLTQGRTSRAGQPWTKAEDERLALHRSLNPAKLAELLDRSPEAVTQRLRRLGLRDQIRRSPHHAVVAPGNLTPGARATVVREMRATGPGRQFAVARRLGLSPDEVRRIAADHGDESIDPTPPVWPVSERAREQQQETQRMRRAGR